MEGFEIGVGEFEHGLGLGSGRDDEINLLDVAVLLCACCTRVNMENVYASSSRFLQRLQGHDE